MLHIDDIIVRQHLLSGNFGLEKEMLRITSDGHLAQSPHPFSQEEPNITRDFCENQVEINTPVFKDAHEVVECLYDITARISARLDDGELLWHFSNPPVIDSEEEIPIAQFYGDMAEKTEYRKYLSERYGRYMMTLSGIHFNYSFKGDMLRRNYEIETGRHIERGEEDADYRKYESNLYLQLAAQMSVYGWVATVLTAASPVMDKSYPDAPSDIASVRCSEVGYWNTFSPVFNYTSLENYVDSIQRYVDDGSIAVASELYYPIRLKPRGDNTLDRLREFGVNHIELRTIDLNPLSRAGIDERDVKFIQLLIAWMMSLPDITLTSEQQLQAIRNYKLAAHFSLNDTQITYPDGSRHSLAEATLSILDRMSAFFESIGVNVTEVMDFQRKKITDSEHYRYADIIIREYGSDFVRSIIKLGIRSQE